MTSTHFDILKAFCLLLYGSFGVFCLSSASRCRFQQSGTDVSFCDAVNKSAHSVPVTSYGSAAVPVAAALVVSMFALAGSALLLAAVMVGTIIFAAQHGVWRAPFTLVVAASAASLVLSLAWWRIEPSPAAPLLLAAFAVVVGLLMAGFSYRRHAPAVPMTAFCGTFLIAGFLLLIDLGGYRSGAWILELLAHHWGAFIGQALHIRAGLVPFYDVPLQYGLGPTLMIAAGCDGADCWMSTEFVVIICDLTSALLVLCMALTTAVPRTRMWCASATVVVFAAVFLWPGDLVDGSGVLATPSVGGIRFMPVTVLACLLFFGRTTAAAWALVPAVLWSPESAAMSITVFGLCETARVGFVRAALRSESLLAGSYAGLVLLHRVVFGVWIDPLAFAEYILHVPGPLPINPFSDALLLCAVLGLGGWLMVHVSPDPVTARRDRTITFLLFAATSYWLGRSHPNNVCNLAPFLVLVAFRVLDRPTLAGSLLADVTGFGLATSVAAVTMSPWHSVPYDYRAIVDIHTVVADFHSLDPDVQQIRGQIINPDRLGIADFGPSYTRHPDEEMVWTPMDPSSLWSFVPSQRRQLYIRRSSARLRRAGWAIIEDEQAFLLEDLRAGYTVAEEHSVLGAASPADGVQRHYVVVCFNPRPDIAPVIQGPACPVAPHELAHLDPSGR